MRGLTRGPRPMSSMALEIFASIWFLCCHESIHDTETLQPDNVAVSYCLTES
jgi:hypothetical protein